MESRKIAGTCCQKQFLTTPLSMKVRCQFCGALLSINAGETLPKNEGWETVQKREICFCFKGKLLQNSSASPFQKFNPTPIICTRGHQQKRAVLCGVTYKKRKHKLKGTINDVNRIKSILLECYGFPLNAICVLTEEKKNSNLSPTKENMQKALRWLVDDCKSGDSLVFYFSGHGLREPDIYGDELDGYNETICPSDFMTAGMILDNDINTTIVKPLKKGVTLHAIIDACHSGTILDLEHVYDRKHLEFKRKPWMDNKPPSGTRKSTSGGLAVSLSACADNQMAVDTTAFTGNEMTGVMTYIFSETIRAKPQITYGSLLDQMHERIEQANRTGRFNVPFLKKMFHRKLSQEIQLSSSEEFDAYKKQFNL